MDDLTSRRVEAGRVRFRNVPIAVTADGFWCCPSQAALHRTIKNHSQEQRRSRQVRPPPPEEKMSRSHSRTRSASGDWSNPPADIASVEQAEEAAGSKQPEKGISVAFGERETSNLQLVLRGREGTVVVRVDAHRGILCRNSGFFAAKLAAAADGSSPPVRVEIPDCDDAEVFVEAVGLMYCGEVKHQLIKHTVPRVLRILKVAEMLEFHSCVKSCLDYLEAVPWVGEEEERSVVSSIQQLRIGGGGAKPLLRRMTFDDAAAAAAEGAHCPSATLGRILDMVLKSTEDRGRREIKSLVLKLVRDDSAGAASSAAICPETLYSSCRSCLDSLLTCFRQAADAEVLPEKKDELARKITLEADNLLWLVEVLAGRRKADDFVRIWAMQDELAGLHPKLAVRERHLVSCITARLFVGIGKGEMLPGKDDRQLLLQVWLQPLIEDYYWLQYGCRTFDGKAVEEGVGRTILTLPLDDQQRILLSWMGRFLTAGGDSCLNLQRAFEVWWRRTFVRPYADHHQPHRRQQQQQQDLPQEGVGNKKHNSDSPEIHHLCSSS